MSSLLDITAMETAKSFVETMENEEFTSAYLAAIKQNPDVFQKIQGKAIELAFTCQGREEYTQKNMAFL